MSDMKDLDSFFVHLDTFAHRNIFGNIKSVWDPLRSLAASVRNIIGEKTRNTRDWVPSLEGIQEMPAKGSQVGGLFVGQWIELLSPLYLEKFGIYIGKGTILEPTAVIKGPAVIGDNCEIRQGAYLRGNILTGNHCVLGHATEVKNSVIMDHTEMGHFNYIGDSILGSHVNLGAGTKLANLQFRSIQEKQEGFIHPIFIPISGEMVETQMEKLGAILGDYVEMGCNSVTSPGSLLGKNCKVYPNTTLPKGFYPPDSFISPPDRKPRIQN